MSRFTRNPKKEDDLFMLREPVENVRKIEDELILLHDPRHATHHEPYRAPTKSPPPPYSRVSPRVIPTARARPQTIYEFHKYPEGFNAPLGPHPARIKCPYCGGDVLTCVKPHPGMMAYVACTALFFLGCVWGCCLVPFCMESFQDIDHTCPQCNRAVYRYRSV